MATPKRLAGKTAVITGGATGIGRATAKRFIEEGAFVFLFGRRQDALDAAVAELGPANARAVVGSVTDEADVARLFAAVGADRGRVDIVVANAGVSGATPFGKIAVADIDRIFDTNVKGTIFTVQAALPLMKDGGGSIILVGSIAGSRGAQGFSVYGASKAAMRSLVRAWIADLKGTGIRINVLSPGLTATDMTKPASGAGSPAEAAFEAMAATAPLGRMGEPVEIAAVAAFLASLDSSFMTGSEVVADGGLAQN